MKKIFRISAAAAAAVLTLVSCQRSEFSQFFSGPKTKVTIGARPEEAEEATRTYIEEDASASGTYHSKWSNSGEQLGVLFGDLTNSPTLVTLTAEETTDNNPIFTGEGEIADGEYGLFVFYPRSAYEKCYSDGTVGFNVKVAQRPVLGSFDPSCDVMGWSTDAASVTDGSFVLDDIELQRVLAILRINLNADNGSKAKGLVVTGFRMEVPKPAEAESDIILAGRAAVSNQGEITNWTVKNNYVEASADASELITIGEGDGFNALYLMVNPATIPAGASINFSIETEEYSGINKIKRTVTVPAGGMEFEAGKVNTINLKVRDKDFPEEVVDENYDGDWLIAGERDGVTFAAVAYSSGNNVRATAPLSFSADGSTITSTADLNASKMTFTKITEEGDYKGMYTIKDANGKYLYAASSSSNYLKASESLTDNSYWTVTKDSEGGYSIVASKSSNRNVMQFNPNKQNDYAIVSCYASTSTDRQQVELYSWSMVDTDPTPVEDVTISTILADQTISASNAVNYEVDGVTVMAAQGGKNYVIGDATGVMLLYVSTNLTVGSQYKVKGDVKLYNGVHEFTNSPTVMPSSGTAPAYGTPEVMTVESLSAYSGAPATKYAVVTATAEASGYLCSDGTNTINVYDGTGTWSQFYGQSVKITGYLIGATSTKINMIATALEDPSVTTPLITFAETYKEIPSTESAAVFSYTKNSLVTELPTYSIFAGSQCINGSITISDNAVTVPITANTSSNPRFIYVDVSGQGIDGSVRLEIKQAGYNPVSISTILADNTVTSTNTVNYEIDGVTVMAAQGNKNYIIADATGVMLMYYNSALTVGKQYRVNGGVKLYNGVHEFNAPTVTPSTGTAPDAGIPVEMTEATLTAYSTAPVTKYAVVYATAETSGYLCSDGTNTINVYDGTGTWSQFYGKSVKVTGYLIGFYNGKINMIATAIEEDTTTPLLSVSPASLSWGAAETGAKTITVTLNASASASDYSYTATSGSAGDWNISKDGFVITVSPKAANTSTTADKVLTLKIAHSSDATVYKEVTLTQSKVSSGGTPDPETIVFANWSPALENGVQYSSPFNGGNFTITFAGGGNDGKYYTTGSGIRTYGGGTITVASSYTISKIEFTWDGSYSPTSDVASPSGYSTSTKAWTGSAKSVVLTRPSGSGHWRLKSVKVTYE